MSFCGSIMRDSSPIGVVFTVTRLPSNDVQVDPIRGFDQTTRRFFLRTPHLRILNSSERRRCLGQAGCSLLYHFSAHPSIEGLLRRVRVALPVRRGKPVPFLGRTPSIRTGGNVSGCTDEPITRSGYRLAGCELAGMNGVAREADRLSVVRT